MKILSLKNKKYILFLGLILITVFACKKIDKLLTFTISEESNITVNSSTPVNLPFNIPSPNVSTNSSQQFQNNNTSSEHIKDIRLKSLQLTITNPANQTFSFLQSVHIYISTNASNEIELAFLDNITSTANTISLIITPEKLDDYIKSASFNLRTSIVTKQILTQNVDIKIDSKFDVTAKL